MVPVLDMPSARTFISFSRWAGGSIFGYGRILISDIVKGVEMDDE
jgi:hypothetical protein